MPRKSSILFIVLQDRDLFWLFSPPYLLFNVKVKGVYSGGFMLLLSWSNDNSIVCTCYYYRWLMVIVTFGVYKIGIYSDAQ